MNAHVASTSNAPTHGAPPFGRLHVASLVCPALRPRRRSLRACRDFVRGPRSRVTFGLVVWVLLRSAASNGLRVFRLRCLPEAARVRVGVVGVRQLPEAARVRLRVVGVRELPEAERIERIERSDSGSCADAYGLGPAEEVAGHVVKGWNTVRRRSTPRRCRPS